MNSLHTAFGRSKKYAAVALLAALAFLGGCADSEDARSCTQKLDNKEYAAVSEDTSCSTYLRASAYMGLAGFEFANFLADGATDNFNTALGIPDTATDWDTWDGKGYYEQALYLSGADSGDYYEGQTRSIEDIEIHLFGALGYMAAELYIRMDANKDGEISEAETQAFTKLQTSGTSYGSNDITNSNVFQFIDSAGTAYLINGTDCYTDTNYDGIADGATSGVFTGATASTANCPTASSSGSCAYVMQVNDIQQIFSSSVSTGSNITTLLTNLLTNFSRLDTDLTSLDIASDSDLRDPINEFSDTLDNGGACTTNTTYNEMNQVLTLVNASTYTKDLTTGDKYKNVNTVAFSALQSSADTTISSVGSSFTLGNVTLTCSGGVNARLIFQTSTSGSYDPDYRDAKTTIATTFESLRNVQLDSSGNTIATAAGDDQISFEELICAQ